MKKCGDPQGMWDFSPAVPLSLCIDLIPELPEEKLLNCPWCFLQVEGMEKFCDYRSAQSWTCDMRCLRAHGSETERLPPGPWQYFPTETSAINLDTTAASHLKYEIYGAVNHSGNFTLCFLSRSMCGA